MANRQAIGAGDLEPVYINETGKRQAISVGPLYVNETGATTTTFNPAWAMNANWLNGARAGT